MLPQVGLFMGLQQKELRLANEFQNLLRNTATLAGARLFQFATGLFRIKISAIILGPAGLGLIDQLTFLTNKISQFVTVGTVEAFVKQLSENNSQQRNVELIKSAFKSYFLVILFFVLLSVILLLTFSKDISEYVFGGSSYLNFYFIALITFPLLVIGTFPFSVLKAFKNIREISRARMIISVVQILLALPIIYLYELNGAALYIPISYFIDFAIIFFIARKLHLRDMGITFTSIMKANLVPSYLRELFVFSGFGLTVGVYLIISEILCRGIVVDQLGVEAIGIYSPILLFASVFTGFVLPSLSTYLFPRFAEIQKNNAAISSLINDALRLSSFGLVPMLFIGIPLSEVLIKVFYSADFIKSYKFLPFHFVGLAFYVWWYVFTQSFTPTGRIKIHGIFRIFYFSIDIGVTYFGVKYFGLYGWMFKHIISPFIFFWVYYLYSKKNMGFRMISANALLMSYIFTASSFIACFTVLGWDYLKYGMSVVSLVVLVFLLNSREKNVLMKKMSLLIKK